MTTRETTGNHPLPEYRRMEELRCLSTRLMSGVYRGIPELTVGPGEGMWGELATDARICSRGDKEFRIQLFESEKNQKLYEDRVNIALMNPGKKASIQRMSGDDITEEIIIDLESAHFIADTMQGTATYTGSDYLYAQTTPDTTESIKIFTRDFINSTPDFEYPQVTRPIHVSTGKVALEAQVQI